MFDFDKRILSIILFGSYLKKCPEVSVWNSRVAGILKQDNRRKMKDPSINGFNFLSFCYLRPLMWTFINFLTKTKLFLLHFLIAETNKWQNLCWFLYKINVIFIWFCNIPSRQCDHKVEKFLHLLNLNTLQ